MAFNFFDIKNDLQETEISEELQEDALRFISSGVACYAFALLDNLNIIQAIRDKGFISPGDYSFESKSIIDSAIKQLFAHKILENKRDSWIFTGFGEKLFKYRGIIQLIYSGYSRLLSHQTEKATIPSDNDHINYSGIALGSDYFGEDFIDNILLRELDSLDIRETFFDLGCGDGTRLLKICEFLNIPGLGIDISQEGVDLANKQISRVNNDIKIFQGDATKFSGIYEEVEIASQFFMLHDFSPSSKVSNILDGYLKNFPKLKYFIYCDTVAMGDDHSNFHPGFDYIHSLLNLKPMSYSETISMFKETKFQVMKEIEIENLPNTYIWILKPNQ